jgi:signal transduction histidine kinase
MDKVFEPYFTTKEMGTGLGLYMSKMIVEKNMGGELKVENRGSGAVFTILI